MSKKFNLAKYKESIKDFFKLPSYGIVYLIENNINGKRYIGQTTQKLSTRIKQHIHNKKGNSLITKAITKYGIYAFSICVLAEAKNAKDLDRLEKEFIRITNTLDPIGYNLKLDNKQSSYASRALLSSSKLGQVPWNKGISTGQLSAWKGYTKNGGRYLATEIDTGIQTCYLTSKIPGFNSGHIIQCCKGNLPYHKGKKWEYLNG